MKALYLLLSFSLFTLVLSAQTTFQYKYVSPLVDRCTNLIEDENGNIYFSVLNSHYALIIKLDSEGSFIDSLRIDNPDSTCSLEELIRYDDDQFLALGYWNSDTVPYLWYLRFDHDLNLVDDKHLNSNGYELAGFHHLINHNGNIVLTTSYVTELNYTRVFMFEISMTGTIIRKKAFPQETVWNIPFDILENPYDSVYKVITDRPLDSNACWPVNLLDSNFNTLNCTVWPIHNYIENQISTKWLNDSIYLLAGKKVYPNAHQNDMGILRVSSEDSVLSYAYFGAYDTTDCSGITRSVDFISPDNIFFAGVSNFYTYPFQYEPSWIVLNILDSNLNLKNQRYFGGDAFYLPWAILATQDGGCLLSCTRFDYQTQNNEFDIVLLKVNQDGLLTSANDLGFNIPQGMILYPNPVSDLVTITSPWLNKSGNKEISIHNSLGKEVKRLSLSGMQESVQLNVSGITPGLCFVTIFLEGKKMATEKVLIVR